MKTSVIRKAHRIARALVPKRRDHYFWWEQDEPREAVRARIRAKIASGEASPNDRFVTFTWTRPEGEPEGEETGPDGRPIPARSPGMECRTRQPLGA